MGGLRAKASAFEHPKAPHVDVLRERHFTAAMQVVLPRSEMRAALTDVSGALRDASDASTSGSDDSANGFYVAHLTLADLLDEGFLAKHVRAPGAKLHALGVDGRIDRDDAAAITPTGQMHLSLTPRAYRRVGVSGLKSDDGTSKRRCVVNLAKKSFSPGNPFRDRLTSVARDVRAADTALAAKRAYFVKSVFHENHDAGIRENATAMEFPDGCAFTRRTIRRVSSFASAVTPKAPALPVAFFRNSCSDGNPSPSACDHRATLSAFHEWLGEVSRGEEIDGESVAGSDQTDARERAVERHRWEGFFVPDQTLRVLSLCRQLVLVGAKPWAALTTWGFPDDPSRETPFDRGGDRGDVGGGEHVTFVVVPGDGYVVYTRPKR
jgi:hypothetical protein